MDILGSITYVMESAIHLETFELHDMSALLRPGNPRLASPNTPLARQLVEDKVPDMLLFLVLRYLKESEAQANAEPEELAEQYSKSVSSPNMHDFMKPRKSSSRPRSRLIRSSSRGSPTRSHATSKRKKKRVQFADDTTRGVLARTSRVTA